MKTVRLGCGAGYAGDRLEPAIELAERGDLDYLIFECLAERTIALAQHEKLKHPELGFDPLLERRIRSVLKTCWERGVRIVSNMGAANPVEGARRIAGIARELGLNGLRIAAITGDDVLHIVNNDQYRLVETQRPISELNGSLVSANAYLGAGPLVAALRQDAHVVITGRVSDPALVLAPLIYEFDWPMDDWVRLGRGVLVGHLLECAGQITGGYFADPGMKEVPDLARLGFPIAEVKADGNAVLSKVDGSGGLLSVATCKEQLVYEVHDPSGYLTPDVVADFSAVKFNLLSEDRVEVTGGGGRERPRQLKVSVGFLDGYIGEGQISYAGLNARKRAELAASVVGSRLELIDLKPREIRFDLIGVSALHGDSLSQHTADPYEVRLRVAAKMHTLDEACQIGNEVECLLTCGPYGGGGAVKSVRQLVTMKSTYVAQELICPDIHLIEV